LCLYCKEAINCGIFIKFFFDIIIMILNELTKIFFALKDHHEKKLLLYKKISSISLERQ